MTFLHRYRTPISWSSAAIAWWLLIHVVCSLIYSHVQHPSVLLIENILQFFSYFILLYASVRGVLIYLSKKT